MEAGVPFALFAGVQLLALAAGVAVASLAAGSVRRPAGALLLLGGALLVVAHGLTGAVLDGDASWSLPALLRAAGYAAAALGLFAGPGRPLPLPGPAVVAPLAAPVGPTWLATGTAALAGITALLRGARDRQRVPLAAGLVFAAAAEALGTAAGTSDSAAAAMLALRGASSLLLLAAAVGRARSSVAAKVAGSVLAGVLLFAVGAASVVGTLVTRGLAEDQGRTVENVARGQDVALDLLGDQALAQAKILATCGPTLARQCASFLRESRSELEIILALIPRTGEPLVVDESGAPLDAVSTTLLRQADPIAEAARGNPVSTLFQLLGARTRLVVLGAHPIGPRNQVAGVAAYAIVVGDERAQVVKQSTGYDATIFVRDRVLATTLTGDATQTLADVRETYAERGVGARLAGDVNGVTVPADGSRPTVHFAPLRDATDRVVAVLALSAPSSVVLATQRDVLSGLFLATILVAALGGLIGVALSRRIVRPVRALTAAAMRVSRGDLAATASVDSPDEVGVLSRAFDTMTGSLAARNAELRAAAESQAALAARLETVLDSMGDALVITDGHGVVTRANPAAVTLLGREEAEVCGRPLPEVVNGFDAAGEPLVDVATGPLDRAGVVRRGDGAGVAVALVRTPLRGGDGAVVVVRDMSREHEVERLKTEFLSNVSHELRTPLTPIRGYAEMLTRRPDQSVRFAGEILDSARKMTRVVDLLVDVASLDAGRVQPEHRPVRMTAFLDERVDAWRRREPDREFRRRVAAGLPDALADPAWLAKAVDELVDNAVKFTTGPVTIHATAADPATVRVTVRDAGPGIPPERLGELFGDFEQLDASATREVGGMGLGLSFVRRLGEVVGFRVHVESTRRGSAFSLDLPAVRPAPHVPRPRRTRRTR